MNARITHCIAMLAVLAAATLIAAPAEADEWTGQDKRLHAWAGAIVSGTVNEATGSRKLALATGAAVAIGKELVDMHRPGSTPSYKDAIVTLAGSAVSLSVKGLRIGPGYVAWRMEF